MESVYSSHSWSEKTKNKTKQNKTKQKTKNKKQNKQTNKQKGNYLLSLFLKGIQDSVNKLLFKTGINIG